MAKIILGKRPTSFKRSVSVALPGEDVGTIEVEFKYRTRTEHAAWADELQAELKAESDKEVERFQKAIESGEKVAEFTQTELVARQNAIHVRYIMGAVLGWNLDIPFDKEAVAQLVDEAPAAVPAILNDYRAAIVEGRLGNSAA